MKMKEIDKLIEKYFEGETTSEEEELLRILLEKAETDKYRELKQIMDAFDYLSDKKLDKIWQDLDNEHFNKSTVYHYQKDAGQQSKIVKNIAPNETTRKLRFGKKSYFTAAAIILIVSMLLLELPQKEEHGTVITDKNLSQNINLAREEVSDVFTLVSDKLDLALGELNAIDNVNLKAIEKLKLINKYHQK